MGLVVIDTDVASQIFRERLPTGAARHLIGATPVITFVSVGELTKWTLLRQWGPQRLADFNDFLAQFIVLPYSSQVALTWGRLQADAQRRGRPRPVNDTWIASCAITRNLPLLTLNTKDYEDLAHHDQLTLLNP